PRVAGIAAVVAHHEVLPVGDPDRSDRPPVPPVGADIRLVETATVDVDVAVAFRPRFSGEPDQAFDVDAAEAAPGRGERRRVEDEDVAAPRRSEQEAEPAREHAVGKTRLALGSGRAQWRVGSIELDGIRYGLTTHCLIAR